MFKVKLKSFKQGRYSNISRFALRVLLMYVHMTADRLKINNPSTDMDQVLLVLHIIK